MKTDLNKSDFKEIVRMASGSGSIYITKTDEYEYEDEIMIYNDGWFYTKKNPFSLPTLQDDIKELLKYLRKNGKTQFEFSSNYSFYAQHNGKYNIDF